jgi:hypothetical protein
MKKKQSKLERAAEKYTDKRLPLSFNALCALEDAFEAGARWQKKQDVAAVKNVLKERGVHYASPFALELIAAPKLALGLKRALEVLTDVQDMVNEQDCRGDEDCDHCVIVHHTLDPAMSEIHAICSEEGK